MKRTYFAPMLDERGDVINTTNNSSGLGADSFTRQMPAGSVGFLL